MSTNTSDVRMPTVYLPHGGGPWPLMDISFMVTDAENRALTAYLPGWSRCCRAGRARCWSSRRTGKSRCRR